MPVYVKNVINPNKEKKDRNQNKLILAKRPESPFLDIPFNLKVLSILVLIILWVVYFEFYSKVRALIAAVLYAILEFTWYTVTIETPEGGIIFKPFDKRCRKGFTSWTQFFANVLYLPIGLDLYIYFIANPYLRVILFPINIWVLEIIEGYAIMAIWGRNVAWWYYGSTAYFHGNIKIIPHGVIWLVLGIFFELIYVQNIYPITQELQEYGFIDAL